MLLHGQAVVPCLLKACLAFDAEPRAAERAASALGAVETRDLDAYFDGRETQLAPLLYWHLKRRGVLGALTVPHAATLERRYHRNLAKNALLEHSLSSVLARFGKEGIEVALLKGATVFSADLTPIRNAFVLSDIDLLVRPNDLDRAVATLVRDGYSPTHGQVGVSGRKQCLLGRDGVTKVDLHSALFWVGAGDYHEYGPGGLWERTRVTSLHGHPVATLAPEDQLSHRLVHDAIGHGGPILATSTARLYYLCLLVEFYLERIDWPRYLRMLHPKQADRLLSAYLLHGSRELGLQLPRAFESRQRQAHADLAIIQAVVESSQRLADYGHQTSLALLTGRTRRERLRKLGQLFVRPFSARVDSQALTAPTGDLGRNLSRILKALCLQIAAVLFISASGFRYRYRRGNVHVG